MLKTSDQVKSKLKVSHGGGKEQRYEWQQTFCQGLHKPEHNDITFLKNWWILQLAKISCKNEGIIKVIFRPEDKKEKAENLLPSNMHKNRY